MAVVVSVLIGPGIWGSAEVVVRWEDEEGSCSEGRGLFFARLDISTGVGVCNSSCGRGC